MIDCVPLPACLSPHFLPDQIVLNSLHSHNYELTTESSLSTLSRLPPNLPPPHNCHPIDRRQITCFPLLLQSQTNMASKCISRSTSSPSARPTPNLLDLGLQVSLHSCSLTVCNYISMFAGSRCGQMAKHSWHLKGMLGNGSSPASRNVGRVYDVLQWYLAMRNYTNCVDLRRLGKIRSSFLTLYQSMSPTGFHRQIEWLWWCETDFLAAKVAQCITTFCHLASPGAPPSMLQLCLQTN
jgi:hypothetical protein